MAKAPGAYSDVADSEVIVAMWQLETASERLLAFAKREGVDIDDAARALEARSTVDGHLLAARLLLSSGASQPAVTALLRRAATIVTPLYDLLDDRDDRPNR